jgi:hypothetical protein
MSKKAKGGGNGGGGGGEIDFSITPVSPSRLNETILILSLLLRGTRHSFALPTTTCPCAHFAGTWWIRNAEEKHTM